MEQRVENIIESFIRIDKSIKRIKYIKRQLTIKKIITSKIVIPFLKATDSVNHNSYKPIVQQYKIEKLNSLINKCDRDIEKLNQSLASLKRTIEMESNDVITLIDSYIYVKDLLDKSCDDNRRMQICKLLEIYEKMTDELLKSVKEKDENCETKNKLFIK